MTTLSAYLTNPEAAGAYADRVLQTVQVAANLWAARIQGVGDIQIAVTIGDTDDAIATGGTYAYSDGGGRFVPAPIIEVRTGVDPSGASSDIQLTINPAYLDQFFYDASPGAAVPGDRIDALTVFTHEIGHGLGILNFSSSSYSANIRTIDGADYFAGSNAVAAYGAPVPLAEGGGHVAVPDLMYPLIARGTRLSISEIDLALLQDSGMPIGTARRDVIALDNLNDTFSALGGDDVVRGGGGSDLIYGNQGQDIIYGNVGVDRLYGGQDIDIAYGGQDADIVYGNLGADVVYGNLGNDSLYGGQGDDRIFGGQGDDLLFGNLGNDTLIGGLGADVYSFGVNSGNDLIIGFDGAAGDRLSFAGQSYTVADNAVGNALIRLSGGGTVELQGVPSSQFQASTV